MRTVLLLLCFSRAIATEGIIYNGNAFANDGGLWGTLKDAAKPARESYAKLPDGGRFACGAAAGFASSRLAIRSTLTAVKIAGATYIAFEALEYAGLLEGARKSKGNRKLIAQGRDYVLCTVDTTRGQIREHLNPRNIRRNVDRSMKEDKAGTTGFATGAFLGFLL